MSDTHETIADIIAEMRRGTRLPGYWRSCDVNKILQYHADRLEAAHKRERGNAAELRESLEYMFILIDRRNLVLECETTEEISGVQGKLAEARAALAAPPRNCERFQTTKQAKEAYFAEVRRVFVWDGCETERLVDWLLAPATDKEGGNDAD